MSLNSKVKQQLKAKAHALKPVVMIGNNGFSEAVKTEMDGALTHHELIKVRIATQDREAKVALLDEICTALQADLVQLIGNIGVIYRKNPTE